MIELSTSSALMLYLLTTLGPLLLLWAYHHFNGRKKKIVIIENDLLVCEFCHFCFLAEKGKPISKCPQCLSYNKSNSKL